MNQDQAKLEIGKITAEALIQQFESPLYVYDAEMITAQYQKLSSNITHPNTKIHYACKANTNVEIMKLLRAQGASAEAVSLGEVDAALAAGYTADEIIFTCSNLSAKELERLVELNIMMNLDSLGQIKKYGILNPGSKISIRINQGIGAGTHSHFITGGPDSKFGIHYTQLDDAKKIAEKYDLKIVGIHQHIGSNILDEGIFMQAMEALLRSANNFPNLEFIDFGGGFGVPYSAEQEPLDMQSLGNKITKRFEEFCNEYGSEPIMRFEAGRYLVAEAGTLLATVTEIKHTPSKIFVGLDTGMNHLIRPAMYNSFHKIVNASNLNAETAIVTVVGNICESGDVFAVDRSIAQFAEGDIAAIQTAGAYGYVMASNYNSRPKPAEVLVENGQVRLIRNKE